MGFVTMTRAALVFGSLCLFATVNAVQVQDEQPGAAAVAQPAECATVLEIINENKGGGLGILQEAVNAAGPAIIELLSAKAGEGEKLTVLAPNDDAFERLLEKMDVTAEAFLANRTAVVDLLRYHVVPGLAAKAGDLQDEQKLLTLALKEKDLEVDVDDDSGEIEIESEGSDAKVVLPDIDACNAVVHVIDHVLLSRKMNSQEEAGETETENAEDDPPQRNDVYEEEAETETENAEDDPPQRNDVYGNDDEDVDGQIDGR